MYVHFIILINMKERNCWNCNSPEIQIYSKQEGSVKSLVHMLGKGFAQFKKKRKKKKV